MHVLYPNDLRAQRQQQLRHQRRVRRRRFGQRFMIVSLVLSLLAAGGGVFAWSRPMAALNPSLVALPTGATSQPLALPWPAYGQAAVGAVGYGVLDEAHTEKPAPTASTAKIFTALMLMKAKPLDPGQDGPMITLTAQDEAIYREYVAKGGSAYPVVAGEQISERRALDALLVVSANNLADTLVNWAYGSVEVYAKEANAYFKAQNLKATTISDASGFSPQTVSTAHDLALAGELLMQNQTLASVVAQKSIDIPGVGTINSTNALLGDEGVIGIKTGNTDEAGGCFVIGMTYKLDETHSVNLVAVTLGAPNVPAAMQASKQIVLAARSGYVSKTTVPRGTEVARYAVPWSGETVHAVTTQDIAGTFWAPKGQDATANMSSLHAGASHGSEVGTATAQYQDSTATSPVVLVADIPQPSFAWRLYKRFL